MGVLKVAAVLLAVAALTFAAERCQTRYYLLEPVKLLPALLKHKDELNLTAEQKERIKKLIRELKRRAVLLDERIEEVSRRLRGDFLAVEDPALIRAQLEFLARLKEEKSYYNYLCIRELRKILTEEQFEKLLRLAGLK
ncbi:MAG: hypothetical protein GXO08_02420 [Aquificae bacterium]|nr:hypothetical protein [Aquificota bacterium]